MIMRPFEPYRSNPTDSGPTPETKDGWLMLIQSEEDWAAWMAEEERRGKLLYPPCEN